MQKLSSSVRDRGISSNKQGIWSPSIPKIGIIRYQPLLINQVDIVVYILSCVLIFVIKQR